MDNKYEIFREGFLFGIKDANQKVIIDPIYADIIFVPNYFDLGFNTFQVVYRLKKSLDLEKYIYLQLSDDDNPENVTLSAETPYAVCYFYRDFSLVNEDDNYIHRLNLDGAVDKVEYPGQIDDDCILSLLRCTDIVRKASMEYGDAGDILDIDKIISFDEGNKQYGWKLNITSLPGKLGFEKIYDHDYVYLSAQDLSPSSAEFNLHLGLANPSLNSLSSDYISKLYKKITDFDKFGFALVQSEITNKWAFINRYFFVVSIWFDYYCDEPVLADFYGLGIHENERLVINDFKLIKLKFNGDFISQILINPSVFIENTSVYNRLFENKKSRMDITNSAYWKIDRDYAKDIILEDNNNFNLLTEENYKNVYNSESIIDDIKTYFDYFIAAHLYWKKNNFEGIDKCIDDHHSEMGIIPSHSYIIEEYSYIDQDAIDQFKPFGYQ
jgi:hypothetical protein